MAKEQEKKAEKEATAGANASAGSDTGTVVTPAAMSMLEGLTIETETLMGEFINDVNVNSVLTGTQRRRLFGAGVRNYGFIEKSLDIASENQTFLPANFSVSNFANRYHALEEARQLSWVLQQFLQLVNDYVLLTADECYRMALRIYGSLHEQARNNVPGARPLFEALLMFFKRRRHPEQEPTEKELERDFKRLLHRRADGEILIENETPKASAGERRIIDDVRKSRAMLKGEIEAEKDN